MSDDLLTQLQAAQSDEEREWIVLQFSLNNLDPAVREAVWAAAIPHWFDAPFLSALLDNPGFASSEHFSSLLALSFIESFPGRGYNVHERTRALLLKRLWQDDREKYRTLSRRAADYCAWEESDTLWRVETISHLLIADPDRGVSQLIDVGWEWHNSPNFAYNKVETLARAAREHADEGRLSERASAWTTFWEALLDSDYSRFLSAKKRFLEIPLKIDQNLTVETTFRLGDVYLSLSETAKARACYEEALAIYRAMDAKLGEANCISLLGDVHLSLSETAKARACYEEALAIYRAMDAKLGEANSIRALGDVHLSLSETTEARVRYEEALSDYCRIIERTPNDAHAFYNRGNTYRALQDYSAALADFSRALELNPNLARAHNNRGTTYADLQDYTAALADYTRALELDPNFAAAYNNRGNTYDDLKNYEAALADYSHAIELDPNLTVAYYNRGNTYHNRGNDEAALADFNRAIELDPQYTVAYNNRGNVYRELKDYEAALADFNRAIELDPQYTAAYNNRGSIYAILQKCEVALADYSHAIELNPQYAAAYNNRGNAYANFGNYEAALADYTKAMEIIPFSDIPVYNTAWVYALQSDAEQSCYWLRKALKLSNQWLDVARTNSDFDSIRDTPEFQALLQEFEDRNSASS
jgi:tetratricopeptide (TPR) repeat protein